MAKKHDWQVKTDGSSKYWVVCADCGHTDRKFEDEDAAKARIMHLKVLDVKPSKLQSHFPKRLF